jgi:hypothetical protein
MMLSLLLDLRPKSACASHPLFEIPLFLKGFFFGFNFSLWRVYLRFGLGLPFPE